MYKCVCFPLKNQNWILNQGYVNKGKSYKITKIEHT